MLNPSYLIRSRHAIYYFRYPIAQNTAQRVSISLKTRCPKEALRYAKALEYHAFMVMDDPKMQSLDYADVKHILRKHFAEVLERVKRAIDKDGPLAEDKVVRLKSLQSYALEAIDGNRDELYENIFVSGDDIPEELSLDMTLEPIAARYDIPSDKQSKEYAALRREYKYALNGYIDSLLSYNANIGFYDHTAPTLQGKVEHATNRNELKLKNIISAYLNEIKGKGGERGFRSKRDCINYLTEVFSGDHLITDIDYSDVRKVKDMLLKTPSNRNKIKETRGLPLDKQIEVLERHDLKLISDETVNNYLGYISGMFRWAKQNKYIPENPFESMRVKVDKKAAKRESFKKSGVLQILDEVSKFNTSKALGKTRYWATLMYVYTGARLNEVASLTPDDVKQDEDSGIWYFDITDEEEGKKVKTDAGKRIVPVHPKLIELGFLEYVEHARAVIAKSPMRGEYTTRLLYHLTYTEAGWGRSISRWFNDTFLPKVGLKTKKHVLHSLRHSFITYLNIAGVEAATIKSMAGHEQGTVTFGVYTHYGVEHLPAFKQAIEGLPY